MSVKNAKSSVPALLTRIANGPCSAATPAAASGSVTSSATASAPISDATAAAPSVLTSPITTSAPSAARRREIAAPIPWAPPVTSAFRPSSLMGGRESIRGGS